MPQAEPRQDLPTRLEVAPGVFALSIDQLADTLISVSDQQFEAKEIDDDDERVDFGMACDAFNLWRLRWRLIEEFGDVEPLLGRLVGAVCEKRGYERDDFELALEATDKRARFPFGLDPLHYACLLAKKRPVEVLHPQIQDQLTRQILSIAVHLQHINGPAKSILLPIEQLRTVLKCRKLVAGGAVKRLMKNNLLVEVGPMAHTGRAREFKLLAKEGSDYQFVNGARTEPKPPL